MDIRYEIAEKRAAEGVVTLDEDAEHDYLKATSTRERKAAVEAAILAHADTADTWTEDVTIGFETVLEDEREDEYR